MAIAIQEKTGRVGGRSRGPRVSPYAFPMFKAGFDKPLVVDWRLDLDALKNKLMEYAPVGKPRPIGFRVGNRSYTYRLPPPAPGRLRASFGQPGAVRLNSDGTGILITTDVPYAQIQDQGGVIPPHTQPPGAPNMMFRRGGRLVFTRSRGPIRIKAQNYVQRAFDDWLKDKGGANVDLAWKAY